MLLQGRRRTSPRRVWSRHLCRHALVRKTFAATGRTRQVRGFNLVPIELTITCELPDKYVRHDEFPAQDAGPTTVGFSGHALIQIPSTRVPCCRDGRVDRRRRIQRHACISVFQPAYSHHESAKAFGAWTNLWLEGLENRVNTCATNT